MVKSAYILLATQQFLFIGTALCVMWLYISYVVISHKVMTDKAISDLFHLPIEVFYVQLAIRRCDEIPDSK